MACAHPQRLSRRQTVHPAPPNPLQKIRQPRPLVLCRPRNWPGSNGRNRALRDPGQVKRRRDEALGWLQDELISEYCRGRLLNFSCR